MVDNNTLKSLFSARIFKGAVVAATEQMSDARNRLLFGEFKINLEEVLRSNMLRTEVMRTMIESFLNWSHKWVLKVISAAWKNIEVKSSSGESVTVLWQVKVFTKAHCQWVHSPGFFCKYQDEEESQRLCSGHLP